MSLDKKSNEDNDVQNTAAQLRIFEQIPKEVIVRNNRVALITGITGQVGNNNSQFDS